MEEDDLPVLPPAPDDELVAPIETLHSPEETKVFGQSITQNVNDHSSELNSAQLSELIQLRHERLLDIMARKRWSDPELQQSILTPPPALASKLHILALPRAIKARAQATVQSILEAKHIQLPRDVPDALKKAIQFKSHPDVVRMLIQAKCEVNDEFPVNESSPLVDAIHNSVAAMGVRAALSEHEAFSVLQVLVDAKADMNAGAVRAAIEGGVPRVLRVLLAAGANPNLKSVAPCPLAVLIRNTKLAPAKALDMLAVLIEARADVLWQSLTGQNILHVLAEQAIAKDRQESKQQQLLTMMATALFSAGARGCLTECWRKASFDFETFTPIELLRYPGKGADVKALFFTQLTFRQWEIVESVMPYLKRTDLASLVVGYLCDPDNLKALVRAAYKGYDARVRHYLTLGTVDVNRPYCGYVALNECVRLADSHGNKCVQYLMRAGADPNVYDAQGLTALHSLLMATTPSSAHLELLLDARADVTLPTLLSSRERPSARNSGQNALHMAAAHGDVTLLHILFRHGARVALPLVDKDEHAPFAYLTGPRGEQLKPLFLEQQHVLRSDVLGTLEGHVPVRDLALLIVDYVCAGMEQGYVPGQPTKQHSWRANEISVRSTWSPAERDEHYTRLLFSSCRARNSNQVIRLIRLHGVDVNARDSAGATALHGAVENQYRDNIQVLLACKADVNSVAEKAGVLPIDRACKAAHYNIMAMLINGGANMHLVYGPKGTTVLHGLVRSYPGTTHNEDHFNCAVVMTRFARAMLTVADTNGQTPFDLLDSDASAVVDGKVACLSELRSIFLAQLDVYRGELLDFLCSQHVFGLLSGDSILGDPAAAIAVVRVIVEYLAPVEYGRQPMALLLPPQPQPRFSVDPFAFVDVDVDEDEPMGLMTAVPDDWETPAPVKAKRKKSRGSTTRNMIHGNLAEASPSPTGSPRKKQRIRAFNSLSSSSLPSSLSSSSSSSLSSSSSSSSTLEPPFPIVGGFANASFATLEAEWKANTGTPAAAEIAGSPSQHKRRRVQRSTESVSTSSLASGTTSSITFETIVTGGSTPSVESAAANSIGYDAKETPSATVGTHDQSSVATVGSHPGPRPADSPSIESTTVGTQPTSFATVGSPGPRPAHSSSNEVKPHDQQPGDQLD